MSLKQIMEQREHIELTIPVCKRDVDLKSEDGILYTSPCSQVGVCRNLSRPALQALVPYRVTNTAVGLDGQGI